MEPRRKRLVAMVVIGVLLVATGYAMLVGDLALAGGCAGGMLLARWLGFGRKKREETDDRG